MLILLTNYARCGKIFPMTNCQVHEAIIAKGFRETRTRKSAVRGAPRFSCYVRGNIEIRYVDFGPSSRWPNNPDANRYVMQLFRDGRKLSGGTAWRAILADVPGALVMP
jgi:hypothetical protein